MRFAIRVPAIFLYPALTSPWEAELTAQDTLRFARRAGDLGFDWLWLTEPCRIERYGGPMALLPVPHELCQRRGSQI